jgi:hypothetical protein
LLLGEALRITEEALGLKEEALVAALGDAVEAAVEDSINQSFTG